MSISLSTSYRPSVFSFSVFVTTVLCHCPVVYSLPLLLLLLLLLLLPLPSGVSAPSGLPATLACLAFDCSPCSPYAQNLEPPLPAFPALSSRRLCIHHTYILGRFDETYELLKQQCRSNNRLLRCLHCACLSSRTSISLFIALSETSDWFFLAHAAAFPHSCRNFYSHLAAATTFCANSSAMAWSGSAFVRRHSDCSRNTSP